MIYGMCLGMIVMILIAQSYNFCNGLMNKKLRFKAMMDEVKCYKSMIQFYRNDRIELLKQIEELQKDKA